MASLCGTSTGLMAAILSPILAATLISSLVQANLVVNQKGDLARSTVNLKHDSGPEALVVIKSRGFIGEMYNIPSRDGTELSIYHLINPFADQRTLNRYPVLIAHGIGGDAAQMMGHSERASARKPVLGDITVDETDTCLAMMLANNNFDVYLLDARGTNLNNHKVSSDLNPIVGQKFWNFSLDEQALVDLPSAIDFILEQSHEDKLHYIAFSESTAFMFALLSTIPEYANKLVSYVALAPVSYIEHITGTTLAVFAPMATLPDSINGNFIPQLYVDTIASSLRMLCQNELVTRTLCVSVTSSFSGVGPNELSHGFYGTTFKSTSIKAVKHFLQLYIQRRFGMYDHGPEGNLRAYGQLRPPPFDLSRIKFPFIILFRGKNDLLSDPLDQQRLINELGSKPYLDFAFPNFNHLDFIMAKTIVRDVNVPAIRAMFNLLQLHSAPMGTILRDPIKSSLPKRVAPVIISVPDGNRRLEIKTNLVNNLINSVVETVEDRIRPNQGTTVSSPLAPALVEQPLNLLLNLGKGVDSLGSQVSHVTDLIGIGSIAPQ